jgi:hypothetical protein
VIERKVFSGFRVTDQAGGVIKPGTGTIVEYTYDALNRRIEKDESGTVTRYYYSDKWQVLLETDWDDPTETDLGKLRNYESQMLGDYNCLHVLATGAAQNLST